MVFFWFFYLYFLIFFQGDGYEKPVVKTEYINLVREKKLPGTEVEDSMSKEQLLVTVQVKNYGFFLSNWAWQINWNSHTQSYY